MPEASINHIRELINQRQFKELIEFTETDPTFVSRALNPALKRAPSFSSMKEAMETAIGEQTAEQFRKIEYLNIIGNLGPLLGLLGTVLGMIEAFSAMNDGQGGASPARACRWYFQGVGPHVPRPVAGGAVPGGVRRPADDRRSPDGAGLADRRRIAADDQARRGQARRRRRSRRARAGATPQPAIPGLPCERPPIRRPAPGAGGVRE